VHILRIRRMNLVDRDTQEGGKSFNGIFCAYSLNTHNESVYILKIRLMNLCIFAEYAERICTSTENSWNAGKSNISANLKPNSKMFRQFIRSSDGIVLPNQIKPKSLMQVLLEGWPKSNRRAFVKQKTAAGG
jgi:hypothetical protein